MPAWGHASSLMNVWPKLIHYHLEQGGKKVQALTAGGSLEEIPFFRGLKNTS